MGFLGSILGGLVKEGVKIADEFHTSDEERARMWIENRKMDLEETKLADRSDERQAEINKIEAAHASVFVSGARPAAMWVCVVGVFWHFIGNSFFAWICAIFAPEVKPPEIIGILELITLLSGLLGLGGMRMKEKFKGVARSTLRE